MNKLFTIAAIILGITGIGIFPIVQAETEDQVLTVEFFSDLDKDSLIGQAAANLRQDGVISGYPDGTFQPDKLVNRAELAKFLLLAREVEVGNKRNNGRFPDVLEGEWYVRYVIAAADFGIISGYPGGNFKPAQVVNTAEFLKMITKNFYLDENQPHSFSDVADDDWFAPYAGVVSEYDLFPSRDSHLLEPSREMTRGEVAVAIYKMMVPKSEQKTMINQAGVSSSVTPGLEVTTENQIAQLAMVYPGKDFELIMPLEITSNISGAKIINLRLTISSSNFLDGIWVKDGENVSAGKYTITVPVGKTLSADEKIDLDVYASVKKGLSKGDSVKIQLDKIEWEYNGMTKLQAFPLDGYELMVF